MPKTERSDTLKMYGDAPDTVSVSMVTVAPEALPGVDRFAGKLGNRYVNTLGSVALTL